MPAGVSAHRLLGELLLDRSNFAVMTQFIADPEHLKVVMILLREPSAAIQCASRTNARHPPECTRAPRARGLFTRAALAYARAR